LNSKINEFYLELGVLTKHVTVMLLIVLAEAALGWNFVLWFYFVVIFRVGVDVLYRRAIRTSGILPVKSFSYVLWYTLSNETIGFFVAFSLLKKANNFFTNFWHSGDKSDFLSILQKMQNITIIYERNACQVRLKYTWLRERFYR
jgi:hypothetical protein